jgi:histidinol phosphatase-like enzyme
LARLTLNQLRWPIIVVTNQSGIGREFFDEDAYRDPTRWMCVSRDQLAVVVKLSMTTDMRGPAHENFTHSSRSLGRA